MLNSIGKLGVHVDRPFRLPRAPEGRSPVRPLLSMAVIAGAVLLFGVSWPSGHGPASTVPASTGPDELASALPGSLNPSTGRTFYVSRTGSDSNPGTRKRPWRRIQKALKALKPGQTALVRGGTYTENLLMSRAGTASAPITVAAYPGQRVVLHAASASDAKGDTYPIQIASGAAYFRLRGFVIEGSFGTSAANVYFSGSANHIELSRNEIRYGQDLGVFAARTTSYLQILGNRIHDNGWNHVTGQHQSHGIYIEGANDLIANNVIYNHPYGFGIQIYPANHDTVVVDNTIAASAHSGIVVGGSGGVYNIIVRNNALYPSGDTYGGDYGVEMDSICPTGPVTIDHNVIYAYKVAPAEGGCSHVDTSGGNTLADPRFVNYASRNLHLQPGSPAVDQASSAWSETSDADGRSRPQGAGPDIGAFEFPRKKRRTHPASASTTRDCPATSTFSDEEIGYSSSLASCRVAGRRRM